MRDPTLPLWGSPLIVTSLWIHPLTLTFCNVFFFENGRVLIDYCTVWRFHYNVFFLLTSFHIWREKSTLNCIHFGSSFIRWSMRMRRGNLSCGYLYEFCNFWDILLFEKNNGFSTIVSYVERYHWLKIVEKWAFCWIWTRNYDHRPKNICLHPSYDVTSSKPLDAGLVQAVFPKSLENSPNVESDPRIVIGAQKTVYAKALKNAHDGKPRIKCKG